MPKTSLQTNRPSPLEDLLTVAEWPEAQAEEIRGLERATRSHFLFASLNTPARLAVFSEIHVYAVWDFMALLHSVRQGICPGDILWKPPAHPTAARLLHEILLEEECGHSIDGEPLSHFESYLLAMRGLKASPRSVLGFLQDLREGVSAGEALEKYAPSAARPFVEATLAVTQASLPERIAVLAVGRERLIPEMFPVLEASVLEASVSRLAGSVDLKPFRFYLERHIEVDGGEHGPATAELVALYAKGNADAARAAVRALRARVALWDGILEALPEA
jgi:hypothetical protein